MILRIAPAVAKAADESIATRPITDFEGLPPEPHPVQILAGMIMQPGSRPRRQDATKSVIYAEGEDERVLRAAQLRLKKGSPKPILIGRPAVIEARIAKAGCA